MSTGGALSQSSPGVSRCAGVDRAGTSAADQEAYPPPPPRANAPRMTLLLVMAGGAVGAGARYLTGRAALHALGTGWPWGTLIVNVTGGLLMGLLVGALARVGAGEPWRVLLGVGVLGGFTTFSSFTLELVTLAQRGEWASAALYIAVSVAGSVLALLAGLAAMRGATA